MVLERQQILPIISRPVDIVIRKLVPVGNLNNILTRNFQTCLWHIKCFALSWFGEHDLNVLTIEFSIVVSEFWSFEVLVEDVAEFGWGDG